MVKLQITDTSPVLKAVVPSRLAVVVSFRLNSIYPEQVRKTSMMYHHLTYNKYQATY